MKKQQNEGETLIYTNGFHVGVCAGKASPDVIRFFESIATEEGWESNGELHAHVDRSTYFTLWSCGRGLSKVDAVSARVVGGLQLVGGCGSGDLPTHRVWPELPKVAPEKVAHVAMLAIDRAWRGKSGGLFWLLTAAMWNNCVRAGIRELWLEATPRTMRCYELLGWPLQAIGPLRRHWGEECYPCSLKIADVAAVIAERAVTSPRYRQILADMVKEQ